MDVSVRCHLVDVACPIIFSNPQFRIPIWKWMVNDRNMCHNKCCGRRKINPCVPKFHKRMNAYMQVTYGKMDFANVLNWINYNLYFKICNLTRIERISTEWLSRLSWGSINITIATTADPATPQSCLNVNVNATYEAFFCILYYQYSMISWRELIIIIKALIRKRCYLRETVDLLLFCITN